MYRSSSTNRVPDDHFSYHSSPPFSKFPSSLRALSLETNDLPTYEPQSEVGKKERARAKFAENAVHVIPFVLLLCGFILWFLSSPGTELPMKNISIAARIEGLTLEGDVDSEGITQNGKSTFGIGKSKFHKT